MRDLRPAPGADRRRLSKAMALIVPLGLLFLLHWPLRGWLETFASITANPAQVLFGFYTAFAVTAASRAGSHLAFTRAGAARPGLAALLRRAVWRLLCIAPWAALVLWTALPQMLDSVLHLERFKEGQPDGGYFLLRIALVLLVVLALANAAADVWYSRRRLQQSRPA